ASTVELERTARYDPDFSLPALSLETEPAESIDLAIGLLRRFLLDPVEVVGRYHLRLAETIDPGGELSEVDDEPLSSNFPIDYEIRTETIQRWFAAQLPQTCREPSMSGLADEFESVYADFSRRSRVPVGAFAVEDQSRLKQQVQAAGATLMPFIQRMRSAKRLFHDLRIGAATDFQTAIDGAHLDLDPVSIRLSASTDERLPRTVRLDGGLPWVWQADDQGWHCLVITGSNRRSRYPDKYVIGPLLTLMAIAAGGRLAPSYEIDRVTLHVVYRGHVLDLDYALDPGRCADYLSGLVKAFFSFSPLAWLPFEPIFSNPLLRSFIARETVNETHRRMFRSSMTEMLKNEPDAWTELTGALVTPDILERARQRFRIFLP
ncbi:MAG: hypothetical protein WBY88_15990, partial [Desulfosarcina sp.]